MQMVQLHNFFFFITSMVVPCGTAAPVLLKWFVSRDVPTGAPFSNGTLIPILIPSSLLLVYLHSRKFIRSMDRVKSGVLVRGSDRLSNRCRWLLEPDILSGWSACFCLTGGQDSLSFSLHGNTMNECYFAELAFFDPVSSFCCLAWAACLSFIGLMN